MNKIINFFRDDNIVKSFYMVFNSPLGDEKEKEVYFFAKDKRIRWSLFESLFGNHSLSV